MSTHTITDSNGLLLYRVGPVLVCSPTLPIEAVIIPPKITVPPGANVAEPGVFKSIHGIVRLVDLRVRFGVDEVDFTRPGKIIIVEVEGGHAGFWVDEIEDVTGFPDSGWAQVPAYIPQGLFSRTWIKDESIRLYAEFDKLDKFKTSGYLRKHIDLIKATEIENQKKTDKLVAQDVSSILDMQSKNDLDGKYKVKESSADKIKQENSVQVKVTKKNYIQEDKKNKLVENNGINSTASSHHYLKEKITPSGEARPKVNQHFININPIDSHVNNRRAAVSGSTENKSKNVSIVDSKSNNDMAYKRQGVESTKGNILKNIESSEYTLTSKNKANQPEIAGLHNSNSLNRAYVKNTSIEEVAPPQNNMSTDIETSRSYKWFYAVAILFFMGLYAVVFLIYDVDVKDDKERYKNIVKESKENIDLEGVVFPEIKITDHGDVDGLNEEVMPVENKRNNVQYNEINHVETKESESYSEGTDPLSGVNKSSEVEITKIEDGVLIVINDYEPELKNNDKEFNDGGENQNIFKAEIKIENDAEINHQFADQEKNLSVDLDLIPDHQAADSQATDFQTTGAQNREEIFTSKQGNEVTDSSMEFKKEIKEGDIDVANQPVKKTKEIKVVQSVKEIMSHQAGKIKSQSNEKNELTHSSEDKSVVKLEVKRETSKKVSTKFIHIVIKGDTLWHIAKRYVNNPWRYPELARLSRIKNPDLIYPGNKVIIVINYKK